MNRNLGKAAVNHDYRVMRKYPRATLSDLFSRFTVRRRLLHWPT